MTVLTTFLKSSLNFLNNNNEKRYKIWYSQVEKWCQSLNCQKHSLHGQSKTKLLVKPTCSKNITVLSSFLKSSLNFLSNNLKKHKKNCYSQGEKRCQSLNCQKHSLKGQSGTKSSVNPTWNKKMTVLGTFLESSLNFLFNNLKKHYKIMYSQIEMQCRSLNYQKHSLKGPSGTKSPANPTWNKKMTILSTFLEYSLNFLFNNLKTHYKILYSQVEKQCQSFNCQKHSLREQSGTKSLVNPTWNKKMTVLSTFLESSLNFLSNNLKNHFKI